MRYPREHQIDERWYSSSGPEPGGLASAHEANVIIVPIKRRKPKNIDLSFLFRNFDTIDDTR